MPAESKPLTEKQKAAREFLLRPALTFSPAYHAEQRRKAAVINEEITLSAKIGDAVPGGDIYAGISPDTGQRMYARAQDAEEALFGIKEAFDFNAAAKRAEDLSRETSRAYRVPTKGELNVLFNNKAAIGNFKTGDFYPDSWYWSSSPVNGVDDSAHCQRFNDGDQYNELRISDLYVRLVRS